MFGCPTYSLNKAPNNKDKFNQKGEKLLFVGYNDESKGYRLLNPINNKLTVARDVSSLMKEQYGSGISIAKIHQTYKILLQLKHQELNQLLKLRIHQLQKLEM